MSGNGSKRYLLIWKVSTVPDVLKDPKRIFNLNESAFCICPKTGKVICGEGKKNVYEVYSGNNKENVTILCNVNASGKVAPTLAVYPGQRFPSSTRLKISR